uniref:glutathione gamma-glutamylcysteinyltransferase n=1 Tax=Alexandrium monilatum TaxID=311494 RepID=A0A7S4VI28_9DINO
MDLPPSSHTPLVGGLHRRPLPPPAIAFSSPEGRELFHEALSQGTAEIFYPLIEQFHTQAEPAFCGLATLVMVLNALNVDPGSMWKGPWRWYHEEALDCCKDTAEIKKDGIEWQEWLCLARCQGLAVEAVRADEDGASLASFEAQVASVSSRPGGQFLVVSYSRKAVDQSGDGHYSPIGAYHRGRSLALVLDTARFKYPPHWLPVAKLWEAMQRRNEGTNRSRGYAVLARADICGRGLFTLKAMVQHWRTLDAWVLRDLPVRTAAVGATAEGELWAFARSLPPAVAALVSEAAPTMLSSPVDRDAGLAVPQALRRTAAYRLLDAASQTRPDEALPASKESLALLVVLLGRMGMLHKALPCAEEAGLWEVNGAEKRRGGDQEAGEQEVGGAKRRRVGEREAGEHEQPGGLLEDELQFLQMQAENLLEDARRAGPRQCCP